MTNHTTDASPRKVARTAGVIYLFLIVFGIIAQVIRSQLIVYGDAATTAHNIMASERLFRISFMSDLIMTTCYFLWGITSYILFKPVNKNVSLLMAVINFVGAPIMGINMLNQFAPLLLLSSDDSLKVYQPDQLQAMAMFFLNLQNYGYLIAAISYGLYLIPLGYLVFKSGCFPKVFGVGYIVLGSFTLIDFLTQFLLPKFATYSQMLLYPGVLVEFSFCIWLLIKGVKNQQPAISEASG